MRLFSQPAAGRTPKQIASQLIKQTFPDTKMAYEIPNAMVGYQPGYGLVADCLAARLELELHADAGGGDGGRESTTSPWWQARSGPYHAFGPDFGSGKPSAASLQLALDMGKYVNSFSWRGDPLR